MRWAALFEDLEGQLAATGSLEFSDRVTELTRAESAATYIADRLRASREQVIRLQLRDGTRLSGRLEEATGQWVLLVVDGAQTLVPLRAIDLAHSVSGRSATERSGVVARLGLGHALRALARDRSVVRIGLMSGELIGSIERVGADYFDVTPRDDATGRQSGRGPTAVPFDSVLSVSDSVRSGWH